jgi:hypothetical protein
VVDEVKGERKKEKVKNEVKAKEEEEGE